MQTVPPSVYTAMTVEKITTRRLKELDVPPIYTSQSAFGSCCLVDTTSPFSCMPACRGERLGGSEDIAA